MKPSVFFAFLFLIFLAGCQTGTYMSAAATDSDGVTCTEIQQAFAAYERDRQSARALQQLTQMIDPEAGSMAAQGLSSVENRFETVRASVNLALTVRGCSPVR